VSPRGVDAYPGHMDQFQIPGDPEGIDQPHDVLAAEEFAIPAHGDYGLHLPGDPHGIQEPHDVLAADEFAMPSGPDKLVQTLKSGNGVNPLPVLAAAALAALLYAAIKRR
jgi:hypothetical protein